MLFWVISILYVDTRTGVSFTPPLSLPTFVHLRHRHDVSDRASSHVEEGLHRHGWPDDCVAVLKKVVLNSDCSSGHSLGSSDTLDLHTWLGYSTLATPTPSGTCGCDLQGDRSTRTVCINNTLSPASCGETNKYYQFRMPSSFQFEFPICIFFLHRRFIFIFIFIFWFELFEITMQLPELSQSIIKPSARSARETRKSYLDSSKNNQRQSEGDDINSGVLTIRITPWIHCYWEYF